MSSNPQKSRDKLWDNSSYRWWFGADTSYELSNSIVLFAIPLLVVAATASPGLAATASSGFILISTIIGIAGGVVQDRYDRRFLMQLNGAIAAILLIVTGILIFHFGLRPEFVVGLTALLAIQKGLLGNTSNAMLRGVVTDEQLPQATSANIARDSTLHIVGGPIGGFLLHVNHSIALIVSSLFCIISTLLTRKVKNYWKPSEDTSGARAQFRTAFMGLWWLVSNSFQRRFILTASIATAAGNAFLLLTVLEISRTTSSTVTAGMVNSAAAAGMFCGALAATWLINRVRSGLLVALMFLTMSTGLFVSALAPALWVKLVFVPIALVLLPAGSAVLSSFFSILVRKENLGRYSAGHDLVTYLTLAIITFGAGWGMDAWGYRTASLAIGLLLLVSAASALTLKTLVTMPKPESWGNHIAENNISQL